jgi:hypothetical protein
MNLDQKAFNLVADRVGEVLAAQGYVRSDKASEDGTVVFTGEDIAYGISYDTDKKRFELRTAAMTEAGPDTTWKTISMLLFDPETDGPSGADSVANDFIETIEGPKRKDAIQAARKKRKKDDEQNIDPLFFFNRMVGIYTALKEQLLEERERYVSLRPVTFTKQHINKLVAKTAASGSGDQFERLCTLLGDMYANGDLDVRSLVTMVILNSVDDEKAVAHLEEKISPELLKAWKSARKYKGVTVKPEKVKKEKKFMADTLNSGGLFGGSPRR